MFQRKLVGVVKREVERHVLHLSLPKPQIFRKKGCLNMGQEKVNSDWISLVLTHLRAVFSEYLRNILFFSEKQLLSHHLSINHV